MNIQPNNAYAFKSLSIFILLLLSNTVVADISRDVRQRENQQNDNYLELGIGLIAYDGLAFLGEDESEIGAQLSLNTYYERNKFFVEVSTESYNGITFGYNLLNSPSWTLDIISAPQFGEISEDEYSGLKGINTREASLGMGIRSTHYFNKTILQFEVSDDISDIHNSTLASVLVGTRWQYRNWNFHTLLGVHYFSGDMLDYYFGIDQDETSDRFSLYKASSDTTYSIEAGLTYPVSENWILRSTLLHGVIPDEIANSPLMEKNSTDTLSVVSISMNYVF